MEDLINYLYILKKRWLIASVIFISVLVAGYLRAEKEVPLYRAKGQILAQANETSPYGYNLPQSLKSEKNLYNELTIIKSENLAETVIRDLNLDMNVSQILGSFNILNPNYTEILEFSYISVDPKQAARIVNSWMENYVNLNEKALLSENLSLKTFLEQQIPKSREDLKSASEELKLFKQKNRILDIQIEATATTSAINKLANQIDGIKVTLAAENTRLRSFEQVFGTSNSEDAIFSTFLGESPLASSMLKELQKLRNDIENQRLRFEDNHPQIIILQKQETILRRQIQEYLGKIFVGNSNRLQRYNNIDDILQPGVIQKELVQEYWNLQKNIRVLRKQLQALEELYSFYKQRINQIPELEFQQRQLEREIAAREKIIDSLIESNQEQQLALNKKTSNLKLIQYAKVPEKSFSNKKSQILVQTLITAVLISYFGAYIIDRLDDKITSLEDIQKIFDSPVLGRIPKFSKTNNIRKQGKFSQIPVMDCPNSTTSEAFRMLFAGVGFIQSKGNLKSISISSSMPNEGKSIVSANLALVGAEVGFKVLLIDTDLRKPSQSSLWNIKQKKGLVNFLKGEIDIKELPFVSTANNLDVVVAGTTESNPLTLIVSEKMTNLLTYCQEKYDLIIIDSPPLTIGAEISILAKQVDGLLMITRPANLTRSAVQSSKEIINQSELKLMGLVLNCLSSKDKYGYYDISYYYRKKIK